MFNHNISQILLSQIPSVVILVVGFIYGYGVLRNKKDVDSINDTKRWESALSIRNTEIEDLKRQAIDQKKIHGDQIKSLQEQITVLQTQVKSLIEKNDVLVNTIAGRDTLIEVVSNQNQLKELVVKLNDSIIKSGIDAGNALRQSTEAAVSRAAILASDSAAIAASLAASKK